jgi:hypothetical protein
VVVGFNVDAAFADGPQCRPEGVGVFVAADVGGVHDAGQLGQGRVAVQLVGVDERFEGAATVAVVYSASLAS